VHLPCAEPFRKQDDRRAIGVPDRAAGPVGQDRVAAPDLDGRELGGGLHDQRVLAGSRQARDVVQARPSAIA